MLGVLTTRHFYNQEFLRPGVLTTRGSYNKTFLEPGVLTTMGSYNQGFLQPGVLTYNSPGICVSWVGEPISLGICVS